METAFQVSPTEDEAMKLADIFRKAADAVVNASSMPKQIADLQTKLDNLQRDYDAETLHSRELDTQLSEMRQARDDYKSRLAQAENNLQGSHAQVDRMNREAASLNDTIHTLTASLMASRKDRDDNAYHALELQEALDASQKKLKAIQDHMASMFGMVTPEPVTKPVEQPQPAAPAGSMPDTWQVTKPTSPEPPAAMQPEPAKPEMIPVTREPDPPSSGDWQHDMDPDKF